MGTKKVILPSRVSRNNFKLLTEHQAEITFMICREKTVSEICRKFAISQSTFFNTRSVIYRKLAVKSTVGLVKYIYRFKYLKF